jgi:Putative type VII ESX secretion system translocon, EccE
VTADTDRAPAGYRFGPRETRGVLLGLRAGQLLLLLVGLAGFVLGLSFSVAGVALGSTGLLAAAVGAFLPVAGRTGEQWAPVTLGFLARQFTGAGRFRAGHREDDGLALPAPLAALRLLAVPTGDGREIGVIHDGRHGTFTAVVAVGGSSFTLLDVDEKNQRAAGWGAVLAALAREGSPVGRVAWLARTVPDSGDAVSRYWAEAGRNDGGLAARSYLDLITAAGPVTPAHETYLALSIDVRRARRAVRQAGGGNAAAQVVLLRELTTLQERLLQAQLEVRGALPPRGVARLLRTAYEPGSVPGLDRRDPTGPEAGVAPAAAGPIAADAHWSCFRSDDGWHATYWVAEWPRLPVGPDFLAPLLLAAEGRRAVALVAEPVPPARAARGLQSARTAELANQALRTKVGQVTTERHRVEATEVERREAELVAGHAAYRFSGYLTVSALTAEMLEEACGQLEHAAGQSLLEVRRLYGQQELAFTFTLPLCRGLS